MQLALEDITKVVGAEVHLHRMTLRPTPGAVTVLLGATRAGKTSLLRLMAGLDRPTTGRLLIDGNDVTRVPVRKRNVSMVYQQFINYPSMRVADNIAAPLRIKGNLTAAEMKARVEDIAARLRISQFLQRYPSELSGGQQQRVALARALAKGASLMLLDEPLVNLDYKLREGLREELTSLFAAGDATVVYATTEPGEALMLGGYTAVVEAGELLQYGLTPEVFHFPQSMRVARAFSDPPMNFMAGMLSDDTLTLADGTTLNLSVPVAYKGDLTAGLRGTSLALSAAPGAAVLRGKVVLAELSGSHTYLHAETGVGTVVAECTGVVQIQLGATVSLSFLPSDIYLFDGSGKCILSPGSPKRPA